MLKRLFGGRAKSHQVHVEPFGTTLEVGARETILQAALRAGLGYPYECQNGACTTCKTQLLEGEIKALSDFAYVLDLDEINSGTILACRALAKTDLRIRVATLDDGRAMLPPQRAAGSISAIRPLTRDILEVRVSLDTAMPYYAGQYAKLSIAGIDQSRSYSFASAPAASGSAEVSFHIRLIPGGAVSGWFETTDRSGAELGVEGPFGIFRLRAADVPILCIAGGSGMAPIKAIIEDAGRHGVDRPLVYLYGARTEADLYPREIISALEQAWRGPLRFMAVLSEEPADSAWGGARGFVTDFIHSVDDFDLGGAQAYLCGPPAMIDAAVPVLNKVGIRGRDIFFDKFTDLSHQAGT